MGIQEVKKKLHQRRHTAMRATEDHQGGKDVWVIATLPLQQHLKKPVKTGRRRNGQAQPQVAVDLEDRGEEEEEEAVTPKGEGCRIPAEAETCPPAPKKPRTAVLLRDRRRCNCDGEPHGFFRVPVDLEAAFASLVDKAN